jgi:hypothetical protein
MFHITLVSTIIISILNVKVHLINRYVVISQGCLEELEDNLEPVGIAVGVLAIIFAIIEVRSCLLGCKPGPKYQLHFWATTCALKFARV